MFYLSFIIILGAAVIIHEFGHFIVAKLLGIRVETFSVGFGKRLFGRKWGTTDYRVSLIPLGGYVKLGGDDSNSGLEEGSGENIPVKERFDLRPRWQKFLVAVAGPVMNILTAIAIPLAGAMAVGAPVMPPPVVKTVQKGGAGEAAGLRPGDRIVSFNGRDDSDWERISNDALLLPEQPIPLVAERDGELVAAIAGDTVIADPFRPTADVVALLRLQARGAGRGSRRRARVRIPRLRLA
jgi:regulator of sigma E protease